MNLKKFIIIILICFFVALFPFLYSNQLGAIGYFVFSAISFYLAYKVWKKYEKEYKE